MRLLGGPPINLSSLCLQCTPPQSFAPHAADHAPHHIIQRSPRHAVPAPATSCDGFVDQYEITVAEFVQLNDDVDDACDDLVVGQSVSPVLTRLGWDGG